MKPSTYFAAAIAAFCYFLPPQADAARCPSGYIYRPSAHVCQSKASAQRAGVYRTRHAKASLRHGAKKAKPARAARKLSAYVGVCKDDKELTEAVLPMIRAALSDALAPVSGFNVPEPHTPQYPPGVMDGDKQDAPAPVSGENGGDRD